MATRATKELLKQDVEDLLITGRKNRAIHARELFNHVIDTFHAWIFPVKEPSFVNPSFSLSNNQGLREVNSIAQVNLSFNFNRGQILGAMVSGVWSPTAEQAKRAGAATQYAFFLTPGEQVPDLVQAGGSYTKADHVVTFGQNVFGATVTYAAGPQPKDSGGADFGAPYPAGTSAKQTTQFEGVLPFYAASASITQATKAGLVSMISGTYVVFDLVAESGGNKQFFDVPKAMTAAPYFRALADVQYFNPLSGQYDIVSNLGEWATSDVEHQINNMVHQYTRYTHNGPSRGVIKARLRF